MVAPPQRFLGKNHGAARLRLARRGYGEAAAVRVQQGFHMISVTTDISSMIAEATRNLGVARG